MTSIERKVLWKGILYVLIGSFSLTLTCSLVYGFIFLGDRYNRYDDYHTHLRHIGFVGSNTLFGTLVIWFGGKILADLIANKKIIIHREIIELSIKVTKNKVAKLYYLTITNRKREAIEEINIEKDQFHLFKKDDAIKVGIAPVSGIVVSIIKE
jgi:hypothetical protein